MNRLAGRLGRLLVLGGLALIWAWPALATFLEGSESLRRLQNTAAEQGFNRVAVWFDDWPGSRTVTQAQGDSDRELLDLSSDGLAGDRTAFPRQLHLAFETLTLVLLTESISLPVGIALAWLLFRSDVPGRRLWLGVLILVAFVPLPLHATAWLGAFGNAGRLQALGTRPILVGRHGAALIHAIGSLPWVVILVGLGLLGVESELEDSAKLDRSAWWVAIHVTMRRALGGIATAAIAVAVLTAGDMTVTDLLQIRTYAEEAYLQSILGGGPASASVASIPPLLVLAPLIWIMARKLALKEPIRLPSQNVTSTTQVLKRWRSPTGLVLAIGMTALICLPIYSLIWRAGRVGGLATLGRPPVWSLTGLFGSLGEALDESWEPLATSLVCSAVAACLATVLSWSLSWLCRGSAFWRIISLMTVAVCLATPGPVVGIAIKVAYRTSAVIYDSPAIVVMGLLARILPYGILILWPTIRLIPQESLETAWMSGYGTWGIIRRVAIPFSKGALLTCWASTFALSMGELSTTNLLLPPGMTTISMRIWTLLHTGVESHLASVALLMLAVTGCCGLGVLLAVRTTARFKGHETLNA